MAAFGWAATYHRDARRKSVFHAAVALCDDCRCRRSRMHRAPLLRGNETGQHRDNRDERIPRSRDGNGGNHGGEIGDPATIPAAARFMFTTNSGI